MRNMSLGDRAKQEHRPILAVDPNHGVMIKGVVLERWNKKGENDVRKR
jgi:hypothetical protein